MPYNVCKKYETRKGREKDTTVLNTLPVVKFFSIKSRSFLPEIIMSTFYHVN